MSNDPYMRDSDAFSWYMEADPLLRSTVVSVVLLDGQPDVDPPVRSGRARLPNHARLPPQGRTGAAANRESPLGGGQRLRARVPPPPHRRTRAGPHRRRVRAMPARPGWPASTGSAPLWEFTLVEGLEGGRPALVMKLHHALDRRRRRHGDGEEPLRPRAPTRPNSARCHNAPSPDPTLAGRSRARCARPQRVACRGRRRRLASRSSTGLVDARAAPSAHRAERQHRHRPFDRADRAARSPRPSRR